MRIWAPHRQAMRPSKRCSDRAVPNEEAAGELLATFERAEIDSDGLDLDDLGLRAPSSTWTYIVSDDPFRDQLYSRLGGTAMGLGIVFNFPLVLAWALYKKGWHDRRAPGER